MQVAGVVPNSRLDFKHSSVGQFHWRNVGRVQLIVRNVQTFGLDLGKVIKTSILFLSTVYSNNRGRVYLIMTMCLITKAKLDSSSILVLFSD